MNSPVLIAKYVKSQESSGVSQALGVLSACRVRLPESAANYWSPRTFPWPDKQPPLWARHIARFMAQRARMGGHGYG
ncbi:MAG: hypothetical protein OXH86_17380 [Acidimicrobiaceae bacterium]|nr:hypothetical protein [Acidimicrobiaceae bacterium]MDE0499112.1 hypothetical protein [Acidimicrobiaceae bacterium]